MGHACGRPQRPLSTLAVPLLSHGQPCDVRLIGRQRASSRPHAGMNEPVRRHSTHAHCVMLTVRGSPRARLTARVFAIAGVEGRCGEYAALDGHFGRRVERWRDGIKRAGSSSTCGASTPRSDARFCSRSWTSSSSWAPRTSCWSSPTTSRAASATRSTFAERRAAGSSSPTTSAPTARGSRSSAPGKRLGRHSTQSGQQFGERRRASPLQSRRHAAASPDVERPHPQIRGRHVEHAVVADHQARRRGDAEHLRRLGEVRRVRLAWRACSRTT